MAQAVKSLRRDAERNRQRIVDGARDLFAQRGLAVTLNDIAHHAGVGVGTVYRHFPDKAKLIDLVFAERLQAMAGLLRTAIADPDPWHAIVWYHEHSLQMQADDRGLKDLISGGPAGAERVTQLRSTLHPLAVKLVNRAKAAGVVRPDCETQDFGVAQLMVGTVIDSSRDFAPNLWRRYLAIVLDGLRAHPAPQDALPVRTVRPQQMDRLLMAR